MNTTATDEAPAYVAWLDLGDGGWVRAFETRDPWGSSFRLAQEAYKAGARKARLLVTGLHPADTPEPALPVPVAPAALAWEAGDGEPTVTARKAVGWLFAGGAWEKVCEDDDVRRCAEHAQRAAHARGLWRWRVIPEGWDPAGEGPPGREGAGGEHGRPG